MRPTTFVQAIYRDLRRKRTTPRSNEEHLSAAIKWLYRSQDVTGGRGSAAYYSLLTGWSGPYPETTGYIIPTLYNYAEYADSEEARKRAQDMATWLLKKQFGGGAFPGGIDPDSDAEPSVFNTGQILFGLVRAYEETGEERFKSAAIEAAGWLVSVQHPDGYWNKYDYKNETHTYCSRVAWALLEVDRLAESRKYRFAAEDHFDWVVSRQQSNGWFENAGFSEGETPFLHTIAYTIRGLLEGGILLDNQEFISSAQSAANQLCELHMKNGPLKGKYDSDWNSKDFYCLTGNAQMAVVWLRLSSITGEEKYTRSAISEVEFLKQLQEKREASIDVGGSIKGSHPIWGEYMRIRYPNWAAKFFTDALLRLTTQERCSEVNG